MVLRAALANGAVLSNPRTRQKTAKIYNKSTSYTNNIPGAPVHPGGPVQPGPPGNPVKPGPPGNPGVPV